jgi:type 1 glutamine amidotransferase
MLPRAICALTKTLLTALCAAVLLANHAAAAQPWVVFDGSDGPGKGKHVVLVSGDEEYRSEEALVQLGRILARHHGFKCTVLFAIDPKDGTINPVVTDNIPGLEALDSADLMVIATRFRNLPDEQMRHIVAYLDAGRPVLGMRTATHAFKIPPGGTYSKYSFDSKDRAYEGGFGRQVLGETWISHHGQHGAESTRGVVAPGAAGNPILRGCNDIWGPTDVYTVRLPLPGDSKPLLLGQVLAGMKPSDPPVAGPKNDPMMPVAWTKTYEGGAGRKGRVFTTTMGAATDLANQHFRRLLVNAVYSCVGLEDKIPPAANVDLVGKYEPTDFGSGKYRKGVRPADLERE